MKTVNTEFVDLLDNLNEEDSSVGISAYVLPQDAEGIKEYLEEIEVSTSTLKQEGKTHYIEFSLGGQTYTLFHNPYKDGDLAICEKADWQANLAEINAFVPHPEY